MVNSTKWFAALVGLLLSVAGSIPAFAKEPEVFKVQAWVVGTFTSTPGESHDAFVLRVGQALKAWTDETGTEACGPIAQAKDGSYFVQLTTEKAQTVCLRSTVMPEGMTYTGDNIHSHPHKAAETVRLTARDKAALRALGEVKTVDDMERLGITRVHIEADDFSPDDYAGGPGYLVVNGTLRYQHGKGTSHAVAPLP